MLASYNFGLLGGSFVWLDDLFMNVSESESSIIAPGIAKATFLPVF